MRDVSSYRDFLKTYHGRTLCPDVFDEFWADVCAENKPKAREVRKASSLLLFPWSVIAFCYQELHTALATLSETMRTSILLAKGIITLTVSLERDSLFKG